MLHLHPCHQQICAAASLDVLTLLWWCCVANAMQEGDVTDLLLLHSSVYKGTLKQYRCGY